MVTLFSGLSTLVCCLSVTLPLPMSPVQAKRTPSFDASMPTEQMSTRNSTSSRSDGTDLTRTLR